MGLLTVVEAAGLCGVPPDQIRSLIQSGCLPARSVSVPGTLAYLIESSDLEPFQPPDPGKAELPIPAPSHRSGLEAALADVQAALAELRALRDQATKLLPSEEQLDCGMSLPGSRGAIGLSQAELGALATRIDRLLTLDLSPDLPPP